MESTRKEHHHSQQAVVTQQHALGRTWVEINKQALEHNLAQYKNIVRPALFAPVVKSNAYGHGIEIVARICDEHHAVNRICVVSLREALQLRTAGITKPILVLSIIDAPLELIAEHDIIVTIYDFATAHALNEVGQKYSKKIPVHVKIDTGLSRLGMLPNESAELINYAHQLSHIFVEGIFTHFANSESDDASFVQYQLAQLDHVIEQLRNKNITIPLIHTSCSAAITAHARSHYTMARAGIGVYGLAPSQENAIITPQAHPGFNLKPVLTWKTTIIHRKEIPAGSYIGYDLTYRTHESAIIATLPVGYWDGYDRKFSNNSYVSLHGNLAPVVGRIAMNLMMVDVTHISGCAVGDEVTLLGNVPGVRADDLAQRCGTINYEMVTRINPLLPRIVV